MLMLLQVSLAANAALPFEGIPGQQKVSSSGARASYTCVVLSVVLRR